MGVVQATDFGVKYDLRSVDDLACTVGSSTCTSVMGLFTAADVGKLIAIQGLPPDWQPNAAYTYGDYILPLTNNAGNEIFAQQFQGISGAAPPVQADWAPSTYYFGALRQCLRPTVNNAGGFVYCLLSGEGGPSGTVAPTWNQTPSGTTNDNNLVWKNEGTSTWCQAGGCIIGDGTTAIWTNTSANNVSLPWVVNEFTGCIQAVPNANTIQLGQLSGGQCVSTTFTGNATPGVGVGLLAFYMTDSTATMQAGINSFILGQSPTYGASGSITVNGFVGLSNTLLIEDVALGIKCPGMNSHLPMSSVSSFPSTGGGFIWFGQGANGNNPMFHIEGLNTRISGCGMFGENSHASRPSAYFELQQSGMFGVTAYNVLENNYDTTLVDGNFAFGGATDGIRLVSSTQMDRNRFIGNAFDAVRACLADLNPQSVNTVFDNNTCQQTPISIYMPNGGDVIARGDQFLNDGQTMWLGQQAHVTLSDTGMQFSPFQKYPHQFIYCAGGPAAGCTVEMQGRVGDVASEYLPFANGTAWGHVFHKGSIIDIESGMKLNLIMHGLDMTGGSSTEFWTLNTPWLINLGNSWGTVDLTGSTGVSSTNLSITGPTGNEGLVVHGLTGGRDGAMHQFSNIIQPNDTFNPFRQDLTNSVNLQGGPVSISQLSTPGQPVVSCPVAGASTLYYKITASNQPCFSGGPNTVAGTETAASVEGTHANCAIPSITNLVTVTWPDSIGQLPASWGIYSGASSGTETLYDCVPGDYPSTGGFPFLGPTYQDVGSGTGSGRAAPTQDTGTGNLHRVPGLVARLPIICAPGDTRAVSDWNGTNGACTGGGANYVVATCGAANNWFCP